MIAFSSALQIESNFSETCELSTCGIRSGRSMNIAFGIGVEIKRKEGISEGQQQHQLQIEMKIPKSI